MEFCVVLPSFRGLGTYDDQIWSTVLKHELPLCKDARKKGGAFKARNVFSNNNSSSGGRCHRAVEQAPQTN